MSGSAAQEPEGSMSHMRMLSGWSARGRQRGPGALLRGRGSPEGRYLASQGKPLYRHVMDIAGRLTAGSIKCMKAAHGLERAEAADAEHRERHRGGERTWLLRCIIPLWITAEAGTAYVAMEAIVTSYLVAVGLAILAALIGAGVACMLANRRLNHLPVPSWARILEAIFVLTLTVLRFETLEIQGAGLLAAAGGAALAAIISALALAGIEEIVVETCSFIMFVSRLRTSWARRRHGAASVRLVGIRAAIDAAARRLEQHFLEYLLKSEGLSLDEARRRAAALRVALTSREA
jgi:hypothetical protein